jgi:two-component system sensor histidine kinase KdpD
VGLISTLAATAIAWPLYHGFHRPNDARKPLLADTNVLMLYLLSVLWVATRCSRGAAMLASVLGVAAFDFCFVRPYLTFNVVDEQYVVTFGVMLLTALVISTLTHRVRMQGEASRRREERSEVLLALSRELAEARTVDEIVSTTILHMGKVLDADALLLLADSDRQMVTKVDGQDHAKFGERELAVARWAFQRSQVAGAGTDDLSGATGRYVPLLASRGPVGVLGVILRPAASRWRAEQRQMMDAFASQVALALERAALSEEARQAWERVEVEFLRNTLLSAVSHDLRTPLAAITGASSSLIETGDNLPLNARGEMLEVIFSEAERMERLINNLLDMTRLESGGLMMKKEWHPIQEVVGSALHHMDNRLKGRTVITDLPADLPLIQIDGVAVEQVLVNLMDNAVEHTPAYTPIEIAARASEGEVSIEIADRGPGLPAGTEQRLFQKFFRAHPPEGRRGLGLGLAICRGIVELHGGTITAFNRLGGGAAFRFTLPRSGTPPPVKGLE